MNPRRKPKSEAEEAFADAWSDHGLKGDGSVPVRELRFAPPRRWRFDFAWPAQRVALEVDGFQAHTARKRWMGDMEKFNAACDLGWRVYHVAASDKARACDWVQMMTAALCIQDPPISAEHFGHR